MGSDEKRHALRVFLEVNSKNMEALIENLEWIYEVLGDDEMTEADRIYDARVALKSLKMGPHSLI